MDRRCVYYHKPLLESGTLGTKGNVQVLLLTFNLVRLVTQLRQFRQKFNLLPLLCLTEDVIFSCISPFTDHNIVKVADSRVDLETTLTML